MAKVHREYSPFSIGFVRQNDDPDDLNSLVGHMSLGPDCDGFCSSLSVWMPHTYELQWLEALASLRQGTVSNALLVTNMEGGGASWFVQAYTLHQADAATVALREQLWFGESLPVGFDPTRLDLLVSDRTPPEPDELPPSEWLVPLREIEDFIDRGFQPWPSGRED